MTGKADEIARWVQRGDALRDGGQPRQAAHAYKRALELDPALAGIHVQHGNMLKDSGAPGEAVAAYERALALGADAADTNLQLGRACRLAGDRDGAMRAFTAALRAKPGLADAVNELVSIGEAWSAQQASGLGASPLAALVASLDEARATLERIERQLPSVAAIASLPASEWNLWCRLWRVPPAPQVPGKAGLCLLAGDAPADAIMESIQSIEGQAHADLVAMVFGGSADVRAVIDRSAVIQRCRVAPDVPGGASMPSEVRKALELPHFADCQWIAIANTPVVLEQSAVGWLIARAVEDGQPAAFCDEDAIRLRDSDGGSATTRFAPRLKGAADPELLDQGLDLGSVLLVERATLIACLDGLSPDIAASDGWWCALHRKLVHDHGVTHVPHVLASRPAGDPDDGAARSRDSVPVQSVSRRSPSQRPDRILAVIPTKDGVELLKRCLDSLRDTADLPGAFDIIVVDNRSRDLETKHYLEGIARRGSVRVLGYDREFNWAAINNSAAATWREQPLLLFVNNDIEMLTCGWDTILRNHLARPEVGGLGARLVYPDGSLQHAGIVLGVGAGGTEHEGRNAAGSDPGPDGRWKLRRSVSAVTGAFLACRRADFEAIGGFDAEQFDVWFNDVDFCLRLRERGLRILYDPAIEAIHHESKTLASEFDDGRRSIHFKAAAGAMQARWGRAMEHDPFYNPHYAQWGTPFSWLRPPASSPVSS
ncbi:MAG: glycosyltransferase [Hyphomicrobiaceae bacterium]